MMEICIYFQVHQPMRLAPYSIFGESARGGDGYFDDELNSQIMRKVASKCYIPANSLMLSLLEKHPEFRVSYSLTGVFLEQCRQFAPEVLESFAALARTGRAEFLSETYYHSLAYLFADKDEFIAQVELHQKAIAEFAQTSPVFRNTEAMFSNDIAYLVERLGYSGILAEGLEHILGWRSPNYLYGVRGCERIKALLRHYKLSDDIGYRFSAKWWSEYPLTADKYARWLSQLQGDCVNIFMDYETFGEHHWEDTGIFKFLEALPAEVEKYPHLRFSTPSELVLKFPARDEIDVPQVISWADMERDTSAWLGNDMQKDAFSLLESLGPAVKETKDAQLIRTWRMLGNSDHFYYMCTKSLSDQDVHNYFSPYDSPFDAYINYMNILRDFQEKLADAKRR
ncbi:MAG: glycoside hydrolase family 57 protein [Candidatus Micrarchaeota archaeon]|nr:glycoside hydrolase family 57 protein [Candidatus Micrarchaeota archaeon]